MKIEELRIGNIVYIPQIKTNEQIGCIEENGRFVIKGYKSSYSSIECLRPILLTEEWVVKFGFSVINENSAGKRYGYVINGVFRSDLTFTFWKTSKQGGKFYRADLQIKYVHQLQNLYFALTGCELQYVA